MLPYNLEVLLPNDKTQFDWTTCPVYMNINNCTGCSKEENLRQTWFAHERVSVLSAQEHQKDANPHKNVPEPLSPNPH